MPCSKQRRSKFGIRYAHRTVPAGRSEEVMTFRSFVGASVLFFVLLPRTSQADPVILSGVITKTGYLDAAPVQFSATEDFGFTGIILPSLFGPSESCWRFSCSPGSTLELGGEAIPGEVRGTVIFGTETFRVGIADFGFGALFLDFEGSTVLPLVVEPTGVVSAPFSLVGRLRFPIFPGQQEPRPQLDFTGSGIVAAFLAPSVAPAGGWRVTNVEYRFGSDLEPIPEPGTLLMIAPGLAALARRQFARHRNAR